MSVQVEENPDHCEKCGEELPEWRREHTHLCTECGMPRCRGCGISVESMSTTSDGGLCIPCSQQEYGHEA